jgi:hypothetical protein
MCASRRAARGITWGVFPPKGTVSKHQQVAEVIAGSGSSFGDFFEVVGGPDVTTSSSNIKRREYNPDD